MARNPIRRSDQNTPVRCPLVGGGYSANTSCSTLSIPPQRQGIRAEYGIHQGFGNISLCFRGLIQQSRIPFFRFSNMIFSLFYQILDLFVAALFAVLSICMRTHLLHAGASMYSPSAMELRTLTVYFTLLVSPQK